MPAILTRPTKPAEKPVKAPRFALELAAGVNPGVTTGRVDETNGVIHGVKLVGVQSNNLARTIGISYDQVGAAANQPYSYAIQALKDARGLYEGASIYSNHQPFVYDNKTGHRQVVPTERDNDDLVGWVQNVIVVETGDPNVDGLYGDFHYIRSHDLAPVLVEVALRNPNKLALSHEAYFDDPRVVNGKVVIGKLNRVDGLALVNQKPGTTRGLFESQAKEPTMPRTLRQVIESSTGADAKAKQKACLLEMLGSPPFDSVAAEPASEDMGADVDADVAIKAAFRSAILAAFDDDSLDSKATLAKIKTILGAMDKVLGAGAEPPPADTGAATTETTPAAESKAMPQVTDRGPLIIECSGLLTTAGILPTANVLESMASLPTPEKRAAYVAELKALSTPPAAPAADPKKPLVPAPRSTIPTPAVNPAGALQEAKLPDYKPGDLARGFFARG